MSLNRVILIGNVGKDPDVKYFEGGNAVANFTLATNERGYTTSAGVQVPERTDWHNIVVRKEQVGFIEKYVKKGSLLMVEGKLRYRDYEKDGVRRFVTEIVAERVEFFNVSRKNDSASAGESATGEMVNASTPF